MTGLSDYERGFNRGAEITERDCHAQMNRERDRMAKDRADRDLAIAQAVFKEMTDWVHTEARDCLCYQRIIRHFVRDMSLLNIIAAVDASLGGEAAVVDSADAAAEPPRVFSCTRCNAPTGPYATLCPKCAAYYESFRM